jgi:hypothetical protein
LLTLSWTWVLALNVFKSFHLGFCHPWLYNHIPIVLQCDVQVAFCPLWCGNLALAPLVTPMLFWFAPSLTRSQVLCWTQVGSKLIKQRNCLEFRACS